MKSFSAINLHRKSGEGRLKIARTDALRRYGLQPVRNQRGFRSR
jgi:hypothetical protein